MKVFQVDPRDPDVEKIRQAADVVRRGGVVIFPTETVYGMGVDALNPQAVRRVFRIKRRPIGEPLILHLSEASQMGEFAEEIPPEAKILAEKFWPGPLTIVLRKRKIVPDETTGGLPTVGMRVPANEVALSLIREVGVPIAAPSANISGRPSPTHVDMIDGRIKAEVDLILDGGGCTIGVESTVISLAGDDPCILRLGAIPPEEIEAALKRPLRSIGKRRVKKKYSFPLIAGVLLEGTDQEKAKRLRRLIEEKYGSKKVAIVCSEEFAPLVKDVCTVIVLGGRSKPEECARRLFEALYTAERQADVVFAEWHRGFGLSKTILDRLLRFSGHRVV